MDVWFFTLLLLNTIFLIALMAMVAVLIGGQRKMDQDIVDLLTQVQTNGSTIQNTNSLVTQILDKLASNSHLSPQERNAINDAKTQLASANISLAASNDAISAVLNPVAMAARAKTAATAAAKK